MSEIPQRPSLIEGTAQTLREHVGPYYDEVFLAAHRLFPSLKILEATRIVMTSKIDLFAGGLDGDGNPVVHMGSTGELTQGIRERLVRRIDLPGQPSAAYDPVFTRIIFGHEVGHVLQNDPEFENIFGYMDSKTYLHEDDYMQYLHSDKEVNADYIAAWLISHTDFGQALNIPVPAYPPEQWRSWAETHR